MDVYACDSMDRFGDDLTEEVLQYMTFEDKIRLECVSKQWKRYVDNKQYVLEIANESRQNSLNKLVRRIDNKRQIDEQSLELVLKKCPNIKKFIFTIKGKPSDCKLVSLIGRYCQQIKSLTLVSCDNEDLDFFRENGHKLEELKLNSEVVDTTEFLEFCPNLKKLKTPSILHFLQQNCSLQLEYLEEIYYKDFMIYSDDVNELKTMSDKYSMTMKLLKLNLYDLTEEELKTCINCISRFENLKSLRLNIRVKETDKQIVKYLKLIGQKCTKLLKLDLEFGQKMISNRLFDAMIEFKSIRKLKIDLHFHTILSGSVECFKHCKQLIELDINYNGLREEFFTKIATFVPKLQFLRIKTSEKYSDSFVDYFLRMKNIQKVKLLHNKELNSSKSWYFSKGLSEVMSSQKREKVIRVNDNCGQIKGNEESDIEISDNEDYDLY